MKRYNTVVLSLMFIFNLAVFGQQTRKLERQPTNVQTESRTALVIGNGAYADSPLRNPVNDATDMAATLKTLGFEVLSYTNLDQNGMKRAIRDFGTKLRGKGGVGLFYYAGHGVQSKGNNYLIPVGVSVNTEEEVEYESVDVGLVLAQMESAKNKLNVVILDACRNNPFARSMRSADKGLASIDAPSGTLLAYSTAPGSVASDGTGRNGLYTQELLKQMKTSELSIEDVFKRVRVSVRGATQDKQTPWESSSLTGDFYFSGSSVGKVPIPTNNIADDAAYDNVFWAALKDSKNRSDFIEFIRAFPKSKFIPLAQKRLEELENLPINSTVPNSTIQSNKTKKSELSLKIDSIFAKKFRSSMNGYVSLSVRGLNAADDVKVFINDIDVSAKIKEQSNISIDLEGQYSEFGLKIGLNETYVIVNGMKSEVYNFKQFE